MNIKHKGNVSPGENHYKDNVKPIDKGKGIPIRSAPHPLLKDISINKTEKAKKDE